MSAITYRLPDATTLIVGAIYEYDNRNSGSAYIQDHSGGAVATMSAGTYLYCRCDDNSTAAGVWRTYWASHSALIPTPTIPASPLNYISGFEMSNTGGDYILTIGKGQCADETNTTTITGNSVFTKDLSLDWSVGSGGGGSPGLVTTTNAWVRLFAIMTDEGAVDYGLDQSTTATNLLAWANSHGFAANYYRQIGWRYLSSSEIVQVIQKGDDNLLAVPASTSAGLTFSGIITMSAPPDSSCKANFNACVLCNDNTQGFIYFFPPELSDPSPSSDVLSLAPSSSSVDPPVANVRTSNAASFSVYLGGTAYSSGGHIKYVATLGGTLLSAYYVTIFGWTDTRGKL